ncbi:MAG: hypothetical protein ACPG7E_04010 [Marinirhabdus sp.]
MKNLLITLIAIATLTACNNKTKEETPTVETTQTTEPTNIKQYQGEFIHTSGAAVLKGEAFIYGVTLNEKSQELADRVAPVKKEDFDMVRVTVMGYLTPKPENEEGWDQRLTITKIISTATEPSQADVRIENTKN